MTKESMNSWANKTVSFITLTKNAYPKKITRN